MIISLCTDIVKCTKNLLSVSKDKQEKKKNRELAEFGLSVYSSTAKSKKKSKAYDEFSIGKLKKAQEEKEQDRLCDKIFIKMAASNATPNYQGRRNTHARVNKRHCKACYGGNIKPTTEVFMCPDHKDCMSMF